MHSRIGGGGVSGTRSRHTRLRAHVRKVLLDEAQATEAATGSVDLHKRVVVAGVPGNVARAHTFAHSTLARLTSPQKQTLPVVVRLRTCA